MNERLQRIFAEALQHDGPLPDSLGPEDVDGWNSFGHLALVEALEAEFGVKIPQREIAALDTVGHIKTVLARLGK